MVGKNIWARVREILYTLTNTFPHSNVNGLSVFYPSPVASIALVIPMKDPSKQEGSIGRHMVTNLAKNVNGTCQVMLTIANGFRTIRLEITYRT